MHFLVFGATGRVGRAFVTGARAAGHAVTAFVRHRDHGLPAGVEIAEGDVLDRAAVNAAMTSAHVVVSTLGGGAPGAPGTACSVGTANLVAAAQARGARRILAVVGAGVLQADAQHLRSELPTYPRFLAAIAAEHLGVYRALRDADLDWTLACAPDLVDGAATGRCVARRDVLPEGVGRVTTGDVAAFLLRDAEQPAFVRTRVGLNSLA